jgi:hypothetical protein
MSDVIVDRIRQVREELIKQHGGIEGYFKHCQALDRAWARRRKPRRRKRPAAMRRPTKAS